MIRSDSGTNLVVQFPPAPSGQLISFQPQPRALVSVSQRDPETGVGRRERRRQEVLDRLLKAACEVIRSRGLENVTVKDITEAADVGKGTFFLHFRTKEHVIPALIERAGEVYERALIRAQGGESVIQVLHDVFTVNPAATGLDNPRFFQSCFLAVIAKEDVRDMAMRALAANRGRIEALVALGQERGEIRRDYAAAQLAQLAQHLNLGAGLMASWTGTEASAECLGGSGQLVFAMIRPAAVPKAARRNKVPASTRVRTVTRRRQTRHV